MITKKRYYRIEFHLASALSVGSGDNRETDRDIVRDGRGEPYIPASALAGIYRALFREDAAAYYFGDVKADGEADESRIIVYDARIPAGEPYRISRRDSVALDEKKTAKDGAKFDFEILEPGVRLVTYVEQSLYDGDVCAGDLIAAAWLQGGITFGAKTSRGLGAVGGASVSVREFSLEDPQEREAWLDYSPYDSATGVYKENEDGFQAMEPEKLCDSLKTLVRRDRNLTLSLELRQLGPISIRVYTTRVRADKQDSVPDYEQMAYIREVDGGKREIPVIPGTSWAGAFRHRIEELMRMSGQEYTEMYFGKSAERKSLVRFGESEIRGAHAKTVTRNSIDRFTGGAVNTALFTERFFYGGETELVIKLPADAEERFLRCLAAAVADLHAGLLSVGGETAIGHGLFAVTRAVCDNGISRQEVCPDGSDGAKSAADGLYRQLLDSMLAQRQEVART